MIRRFAAPAAALSAAMLLGLPFARADDLSADEIRQIARDGRAQIPGRHQGGAAERLR